MPPKKRQMNTPKMKKANIKKRQMNKTIISKRGCTKDSDCKDSSICHPNGLCIIQPGEQ